jgi:quercetin dioxygenase-like cupin family protein
MGCCTNLAIAQKISTERFIKSVNMILANINELMLYDKISKSALYKEERFHIMLLNLPEGEELKPHLSKTDACCVVQKGEAEFILEGLSSSLRKGDVFTFKAGQEHAVKAITDFSMLIIK